MKSLSYKGLYRLLMLMVAFATVGSAAADNRLYIPDFTVESTSPVEVELMLDNTDPIAGIQVELMLPEGLTATSFKIADARKQPYMNPSFNPSVNGDVQHARIMISSFRGLTFKGNEGSVGTITLQPTAAFMASNANKVLKLEGIKLSGPDVQNDPSQMYTLPDETTNISVAAGEFKVTADPTELNVMGGKTYTLAIGLENSAAVQAFQADINLPAGVTVNEESFAITSRCDQTVMPLPTVRPNGVVNVVVMNFASTADIISGTNEGNILTFDINVAEGYNTESAEILVNNVVVSALGSQEFDAGTVTITLKNDANKLAEAQASVQELRDALAAALETIATDCPDVKDQFTGEDITSQIDALEAAINEAYENGTLSANYETVMAPVADIQAAITKLVEDAKAAQAAVTANNEAKTNADAKVAELEQALATALETIATECPDVKDQFTGAEITDQINALKAAIEEAYTAGTLATDYETVMTPATAIEEAIAKLVEDAKAAQAEVTAKANADAKVAGLEQALADALATIATDCPDVKDQFTGSEITEQINALKTAIANAVAEGTLAENYDTVMTPAAAIEAAIEQLIADAKAAQTAYNEATAANDEAKAKADAKVAELEQALADALATIAEKYPSVKDQFTGENVTALIDALKNAILDAYNNRTLAADYETVVTTPAAEIEAAIAKLVADAQAAVAAQNEEERKALNAERYNADMAALDALQAKLDQTSSTVAIVYPGFDAAADVTAAQNAINEARAAVEAAYAAVENEGIYEYQLDTQSIENLINNITAHAALDKAQRQVTLLRNALAEALETIADECPLVKDQFTGADIKAQIDALEEAINAHNAAGDLAAKYDEVMAPVTSINVAISKLLENARAAQAAEVQRRADNEAAYNADLDAIAALQTKLNEAKAQIAAEYPTYDATELVNAIQAMIDDAKDAADAEYAAVAEEGTYQSTLDVAAIEHKIQDLLDAASGIEDILVEEIENGNVMIYTIDGRKVARPVQGQINIFVDRAGNVTKKFIR